ncbi:unnamed protein product [Prorocentrum cordatum]|uniref:Uncharacterized protein n=1 Tax=Prorocentrum cordatum TaxID=2364126 RepID=A0ABN9XLM9_9DINO|nr:unnamed protein product [Polarella glacialis]|mmetsp:Transcript_21089/g.55275  ORF Transcript_21089/g.55275 Transcript_21089/m.55275 type:complete len:227 (-) Transcript_21089:298-978(-)
MTPAVLAALALLGRTAIANRGNVALELGGGAHMKAGGAHQGQELSELKGQLWELQERVDRLEAAHVGAGAATLQGTLVEGHGANTTARTRQRSAVCQKCLAKKRRLWAGHTACLVTTAVTTVGVSSVTESYWAGAAGVGAGSILYKAMQEYSSHLDAVYPCESPKPQVVDADELRDSILQQVRTSLKQDMKDATAEEKAEVNAALGSGGAGQIGIKIEEEECVDSK